MSAEISAAVGRFTRLRLQFRVWRGTRPFWAGLFVMLGGFPIAYFPYGNLRIGHLTLAMATTAGAGSLIIGVLLVVLGLSLWFQRHVRVFAGVAAILLALVSIPVSNLGGFLIGFLLALVGGAMAVAWAPGVPPAEQPPTDGDGDSGTPKGATADTPVPELPDGTASKGEEEHPGASSSGTAPAEDGLSETSPADGTDGRHRAG